MATREEVRQFSSGANQSGLRDYNERLLLSMIQRFGPSAGSDLARQAGHAGTDTEADIRFQFAAVTGQSSQQALHPAQWQDSVKALVALHLLEEIDALRQWIRHNRAILTEY